MELKNIFNVKSNKIVFIAAAVNLAILYFFSGVFDVVSYAIYGLVAYVVMRILQSKRMTIKNYFIVGAIIPIVYNGLGHFIGWFQVPLILVIMSAIQQGVITAIVASLQGVKTK